MSFYTLLVYEVAIAVLPSVAPHTLIDPFIGPVELAVAVLLVVEVFSGVLSGVNVSENTFALPLIVLQFSDESIAIKIGEGTLTMRLRVLVLALVDRPVGHLLPADSVLLVGLPVADVSGAVQADKLALALSAVVDPLAM